MKIKKTLFILLLVFSLLPLYFTTSILTYNHTQSINKFTEENLEAISETLVLNIKDFYSSTQCDLQTIAQYALVQDVIRQSLGEKFVYSEQTLHYMHDLLEQHKQSNPFVASVSVVNRDFQVVYTTERHQTSTISELKNSSEDLTREFFMGKVSERETDEGLQKLIYACKTIEKDGNVIGYVIEEINIAFFDKFRTAEFLFPEDIFSLTDGYGQVITEGCAENGELKDYVPSEEMQKAYKRVWKTINLERHPSGKFTYEADGNEYITYYATIENSSWLIQLTANLTSRTRNMRNDRLLLIMTAICVTAILLVGNSFVSKQLVSPIEQIEYTLKRIQETGNYSIRVLVQGGGEIGYIARQINALIDHVEQENLQGQSQQQQLAKKATSDLLTGIENKQSIHDSVKRMVERANEMGAKVVVGFMDIDDFKDFNTLYGHQQGDEVLKYVAKCLSESISGVVGRNGGDEFMFCMLERRSTDNIQIVLENLMKKIRQGVVNTETGKVMKVTCSIGVIVAMGPDAECERLIHDSDTLMYEVKGDGKDHYLIRYETDKKGQ